MELQAHTKLQGELLVTTATGTVAFEPALQILKGICDLAAEKRVHKILVDTLAVDGTLSTLERCALAMKVTEHLQQLQFNPKLAFVGRPLPRTDSPCE